jgi:hypothetical protein
VIVKSSFRRAGELGRHLLRSDTNEVVRVRDDHFRDAPLNISDALRSFDGIARSNPRTTRSFVHVIVSPYHELTEGN